MPRGRPRALNPYQQAQLRDALLERLAKVREFSAFGQKNLAHQFGISESALKEYAHRLGVPLVRGVISEKSGTNKRRPRATVPASDPLAGGNPSPSAGN